MFVSKAVVGFAAIGMLAGVAVAQDDAAKKITFEQSLSVETLGQDEVAKIIKQAEKTSAENASMKGLRTTDANSRQGKFHIFVVDRKGKVLGSQSQPDAWVGSVDIALGKARTASFFSSDENALTSRDIGALSQAHGADGTGKAGPLWGIGNTNQGDDDSDDDGDKGEILRNTLVTFPGGVPLYKNGHLVGAIGVSGDGVDQDEAVAYGGAQGFLPGDGVGKISEFKSVDIEKVKK